MTQLGGTGSMGDFIMLLRMVRNLKLTSAISGIFHLVFSYLIWLEVSETAKSEAANNGRLL